MINAIVQGLMKLIMGLVEIILTPIDLIIESALPDLSVALNSIGSFFDLAGRSIGWCISLTGISSTALSIIVLYYVFKLTTPILFSSIKAVLKWYNTLKL